MIENAPPPRHLPVRLPPVTDELLSSWISRHADFYAVPPLVMLQHCLPEVHSLRNADLHLSGDQAARLASMFSVEPAVVRQMSFARIPQSSHRLIAARPIQLCSTCHAGYDGPRPSILRSQLLGWRITCPLCGDLLRDVDGCERPSPFRQYRDAALRGEKLLDKEAEHSKRTWTSPSEIAQLLLMRRVTLPPPREEELWRFRVLGAIVPDLDDIIAAEQENLPTSANPVLPLHLRAALLAGVAIVERAGPEMLRMLRGHTMGGNRVRFTDAAEKLIARAPTRASPQMQLI